MRLQVAVLACTGATLLGPQTALAQQLGGARPIDIPIVQILAGLLLCSLAAFAFALFLRRRSRAPRHIFGALLRRGALAHGADGIVVHETRRLSPHADVCRFSYGERDFLVVVTASSCTVLRETPVSPPIDDAAAEPTP